MNYTMQILFLQSSLKHFEHKFEHHLIWADKSGMWFSLETRFPYLDHRLIHILNVIR